MASTGSAIQALQDSAALWSVGAIRAAEVVGAACGALVAGLDSPALRALAACTRGEADHEVPELLPAALAELGLVRYQVDTVPGQEAAVRALAELTVRGRLAPRELALRIHQCFGHQLPLAERLAAFDDEYDLSDCGIARPSAEIDAEVEAEARRLARSPGTAPVT